MASGGGSGLEIVVRPNVAPDYSPERRFIPSGQRSADPVLVQLGRGGQGKTFTGTASTKQTFYCEAAENEFMGNPKAFVGP